MKPSYAHVPDPNAGGTCQECKHARVDNKKSSPGGMAGGPVWTKRRWTCAKAIELTRYAGEAAPIKPETQGCKFWEFAR